MKINLKGRLIDHNFYMLTGREAWALARETGGRAPHFGYEKRVDVNGQPAWLTRTTVLGKPVWAVYGRDLKVEPPVFNMYDYLSYNTIQRIRLHDESQQGVILAHEILRCFRNDATSAKDWRASTLCHGAMLYCRILMDKTARERWAF